jgi:hypothetical protein
MNHASNLSWNITSRALRMFLCHFRRPTCMRLDNSCDSPFVLIIWKCTRPHLPSTSCWQATIYLVLAG